MRAPLAALGSADTDLRSRIHRGLTELVQKPTSARAPAAGRHLFCGAEHLELEEKTKRRNGDVLVTQKGTLRSRPVANSRCWINPLPVTGPLIGTLEGGSIKTVLGGRGFDVWGQESTLSDVKSVLAAALEWTARPASVHPQTFSPALLFHAAGRTLELGVVCFAICPTLAIHRNFHLLFLPFLSRQYSSASEKSHWAAHPPQNNPFATFWFKHGCVESTPFWTD